MLDNNNNYYNGHLERIVNKQVIEVNGIHIKVLDAFRSLNSQENYFSLINKAIVEFNSLYKLHIEQMKYLVKCDELELNSFYKNNALNYKIYYNNNLLNQNIDSNNFNASLLLFTAESNILNGNRRVDYVKKNEFDLVLFIFPESEYLWKYLEVSLFEFLDRCGNSIVDGKYLLYEIERVQMTEILEQCKIIINFMMCSKSVKHIKEMLNKSLYVLEEMCIRHNNDLGSVSKIKNITISINNNALIYDIIHLIKYNFCIYNFEDELEVCDAINWFLDKLDIIKAKLYNKYV